MGSLAQGEKPVADPRLGADVFGLRRIFFDLFAELADKNAQVFGLLGKIAAPDRGQDRAVGDDLAAIAEEKDKQVKFLWRQMDRGAGDHDHTCRNVDVKIAVLKHRFAFAVRVRRPAKRGARTRASSSSMPKGFVT